MKRALTFAGMLVLGLAVAGSAQAPAGPPKPGPENKKLEYFVGKWTMEGEMKASPFGPGGKTTATENCEWFAGGFQIVCKSEGKGPMGEIKGLGLLGYNRNEKAYYYYGIDNMGMGSTAKGTLVGDTWTWSGEDKMGGKLIKSRFTVKQGGPSMYTFKWETSEDGKTWTAVMEGKETRAK